MSTSPSGVYLIASNEKRTEYVYCHMGTLCGSDGGWTRLAHLDMTDPTESCPNGWKLYEVNGVRACGRASSGSGSCSSVQYPSHDIRYTEICGRVRGYQYYSTDAVFTTISNINSYYVSLTRGNPRQHVWTTLVNTCGHSFLDLRKTIHTVKVHTLALVKLAVNSPIVFLLLLEVTIIVNLATHPHHQVLLPSSMLLIHYGMVNSVITLSLLVAAPQCFLGFTNP